MDHYAALGVSPNAGNAELNNAFKKKTNAIRAPPNNNITRRHTLLRNSALERKALKNSYNLLKNKGKRAEYNKTRKTIPSKHIYYTYVIEKLTTNEDTHPSFPGEKFDEKSISRFEEKVNTFVKKGLKLHGDIIVTSGIIPSTRMQTSGTSKFLVPAEYSNNMLYQVLINGYGKPDYTEYKLLPIRVFGNGSITLATEEERKKKFLKDINAHLEDGWKLYNGPVELQLNRNVTSIYEHRGYIYQAIVR
jgi:curved DNA-binding protein CbpA